MGVSMKHFFCLLLLGSTWAIHDKYIDVDSYSGYQVLRLWPQNDKHLSTLTSWLDDPQLEFWTAIGRNRPVDIMVTPQRIHQFRAAARSVGLSYDVQIQDVQELIDQQSENKPQHDGRMTWDDYYNYEEIMTYLDEVSSMYDFAETEVIGTSYEGRDMKVLKLCKDGCGNKPAIWLDGGIHAREWISPAVTTYAINELTANLANQTDLLDNLDWYLLPMHNPDGYTFTIEHARLWRKTRSDSGSIFECRGTDANRNFGYHWNTGGASNDKCFDTYHGPTAFSEPETAAVRDYILTLNGTVKYFNSQHSYSQLILLPWGFTSDPPDNNMDLVIAADIGNEALKSLYGTEYTIGCIPCILYIASGGSADWALGSAGVPLSYSVELRDTGRYGFLLPRDLILPTSEEIWAFHKAVARHVVQKF